MATTTTTADPVTERWGKTITRQQLEILSRVYQEMTSSSSFARKTTTTTGTWVGTGTMSGGAYQDFQDARAEKGSSARTAYLRCKKHGKFWTEGEDFERNGGRACEKCIESKSKKRSDLIVEINEFEYCLLVLEDERISKRDVEVLTEGESYGEA